MFQLNKLGFYWKIVGEKCYKEPGAGSVVIQVRQLIEVCYRVCIWSEELHVTPTDKRDYMQLV